MQRKLFKHFKAIICKESFESIEAFYQLCRALVWQSIRRIGLIKHSVETMEDQGRDRIIPFDEYPPCEMCGCDSVKEQLITKDGSHIVACDQCGLWFTSPRIEEKRWEEHLCLDNERNKLFTENRRKYGKALSANIIYTLPSWRKELREIHNNMISSMETHLDRRIERLHDVGCGVGLFMEDAKKRGISVTGNDLNAYACDLMNNRLGLTVYNETLPNLRIENESLDAIVMNDYIEHTYHPLADLRAAHRMLKPKGVIYIETFHIDCKQFYNEKENWNMLFWNHVYHFSDQTLKNLVKRAGFKVVEAKSSYESVNIAIVARKE